MDAAEHLLIGLAGMQRSNPLPTIRSSCERTHRFLSQTSGLLPSPAGPAQIAPESMLFPGTPYTEVSTPARKGSGSVIYMLLHSEIDMVLMRTDSWGYMGAEEIQGHSGGPQPRWNGI